MAAAGGTGAGGDELASRASVKRLMADKDSIEAQIAELRRLLQAEEGGEFVQLVDADGFPIGDVDKIVRVRNVRHRLAELQFDHKSLMARIEQEMSRVLGRRPDHQQQPSGASNAASTPAASPGSAPPAPSLAPFATVSEVADGSPGCLDIVLAFRRLLLLHDISSV
eukprot:TRINITY_DN2055_c0_g1_i1.p4 TRINITY_DN2055_c0_g1~~TRINITY_DN2055_c0_g1_i1.p4  ORF type:complete len:167 (+),score=64.15 TRINITY_DN2055_c0_g1_i1:2853-3353(+)